MRTCQPQVAELMANPFQTDSSSLVNCAKAHSSTIGGACERLVEKLTKDGLAEKLLDCGKVFVNLCPAETMALMAAETSQVNWPAVHRFVVCLSKKKNKSQVVNAQCGFITDAMQKQGEQDDPNWKSEDQKAKSYEAKGDKHEDEDEDEDNDDGSNPAAIIVSLLGICTCATVAGVAYWKRGEIQGMMQQRRPAPGNWRELDVEQSAGLTQASVASTAPPTSDPPGYAVAQQDDIHMNIVTATPIN
jgi:hypothetical protein